MNHYNTEEKTSILCRVYGLCDANARKITEAMDSLTFRDLRELAKVIQLFSKGK